MNVTCHHCGAIPTWKKRRDESCGGWSTDAYMWLECVCGMRTIEREVTYNLERHKDELLKIFMGAK